MFCTAVMVVVTQVNSHSSFRLPARSVSFQRFLQNPVEEQALQWVTLFGSFLDLEHVTFFVCQYCGFLVSVQFLQEADVIMFDTAGFEAFQFDLWEMGSNALMRSIVAVHILIHHSWQFWSITLYVAR